MPLLDMFIFGIALAVAVVPEALPAVVTISLAIGVRRMVKRQALVRRLPVVETLGSTSTICSDKTGTLTRNEMTVRRVATADGAVEITGVGYDPVGEFRRDGAVMPPPETVRDTLSASVLASDARVRLDEHGAWRVEGDPTEAAFVVAAEKAGLDQGALNQELPRRHEIAFTSERRRMTTLHEDRRGALTAFSKGSVDVVLPDCAAWARAGGDAPLQEADRAAILAMEREMAAAGLRVLAIARKRDTSVADAEHGMTLLGLVGMMDPPRAEARAAVQTCWDAGITPVMITGDHPLTANAVADEIGLLRERRVVSGRDLTAMSDDDLYPRRRADRRLRAGVAGRQAARGGCLAAARRRGRHDRRRRQRRTGVEEGRRRYRDGHLRHRREQGSGGRHAARRQLRLHRRGGRGGADRLQQHPQVPHLPAVVERRRNPPDGGRRAGWACRCRSRRCRSCT